MRVDSIVLELLLSQLYRAVYNCRVCVKDSSLVPTFLFFIRVRGEPGNEARKILCSLHCAFVCSYFISRPVCSQQLSEHHIRVSATPGDPAAE